VFIKFCLDCEHEIYLGSRPRVGQKVTCPNCEVKLEIINVEPLEFDWVYEGPVIDLSLFDEEWRSLLPGDPAF
jgi:hypothetical protein